MDEDFTKVGVSVYILPPAIQLPRTLAFRNRDGVSGLLQITGYTDNPRGVKLRYKLVQETTQTNLASKLAQDERFSIPDLTSAQRVALITEASQSFRQLVQKQKGQSKEIPRVFWGPTIASLKPLRVVNDRVNIKIVLAERGGIEAGFYVNQPISSFAPPPNSFLEFVQLSQPADKAFGTLYRYRLAQNAAASIIDVREDVVRPAARFAPVGEAILPTGELSPRFLNLSAGRAESSATTNFPLAEVHQNASGVLELGIYNIHAYLVEDRERGRREFENLSAEEFIRTNEMAGMFLLPFERFSSFEIQKTNLPMTILMPYAGYFQVTEIIAGKYPSVKIRYKLLDPSPHKEKKPKPEK